MKLDLGGGDGLVFRNATMGAVLRRQLPARAEPARRSAPRPSPTSSPAALSIWDPAEQPDRHLAAGLRLPGRPGHGLLHADQQRREADLHLAVLPRPCRRLRREPVRLQRRRHAVDLGRPSSNPRDLRLRLHLGLHLHQGEPQPDLRLLRDARRHPVGRGRLAGLLADPHRRLLAAGARRHGGADLRPARRPGPPSTPTAGGHTASGQLNFTPGHRLRLPHLRRLLDAQRDRLVRRRRRGVPPGHARPT